MNIVHKPETTLFWLEHTFFLAAVQEIETSSCDHSISNIYAASPKKNVNELDLPHI